MPRRRTTAHRAAQNARRRLQHRSVTNRRTTAKKAQKVTISKEEKERKEEVAFNKKYGNCKTKFARKIIPVSFSSIPDEFNCTICYMLMIQPQRLGCGHLLCLPCLESLSTSKGKNSCPFCRQPIKKADVSFGLIEDRLIGCIDVYCINKKQGCPWKEHMGLLEEHLKYCIDDLKEAKEFYGEDRKFKTVELGKGKDRKSFLGHKTYQDVLDEMKEDERKEQQLNQVSEEQRRKRQELEDQFLQVREQIMELQALNYIAAMAGDSPNNFMEQTLGPYLEQVIQIKSQLEALDKEENSMKDQSEEMDDQVKEQMTHIEKGSLKQRIYLKFKQDKRAQKEKEEEVSKVNQQAQSNFQKKSFGQNTTCSSHQFEAGKENQQPNCSEMMKNGQNEDQKEEKEEKNEYDGMSEMSDYDDLSQENSDDADQRFMNLILR